MLPLLLTLPLLHAADLPRAWVGVGVIAGAGSDGGLGGVAASGGVRLADNPMIPAAELHVREGVAGGEPRSVTDLGFDARWPAQPGPHLVLGFAHDHETDLDTALAHPVENALAILPGITHRTGLELGGGWEIPTRWEGFAERLRPTLRATAIWFPASDGPPVYGVVELGASLLAGPL